MVLRRIGVWSAAKIIGALYTALGLLMGVIFATVTTLGGLAAAQSEDMPRFLGAFLGVGAIVLFPLMYGCMGLIGGAIGAALYNVFSGMVGGLELDIQPPTTVRPA